MRKSTLYALVLLGITTISSQIVLIREFFTAFYGNELSVGFVLAIWLLGGALGSGIIGSLFSDRIQKKSLIFSLTQILLSFLIPSAIVLARVSRLAFGIGVGEIISIPFFMASSAAILLPIAAGLGFLFVLGSKMLPRDPHAAMIGRVYTLEAIGAALGGAITSLILIRHFGALEIAFMLSGLNLISAVLLLNKARLKYIAIVLIVLLGLFTILGGINFLDRESLKLKWGAFQVLKSEDSIYGRMTVTLKDAQLNFFNNGLFLFSSNDPLTREETAHFPLVFTANPKRVLLIGGSSEVIYEILKHPVESVDYVELNPLTVAFSKELLKNTPFYKLDDPRVNIINEDGRYFIKNAKALYDAIIINLPNPYTAQINRFYTKEFFKNAACVLAENGILSFAVSSNENYISKEQSLFLKTLLNTAESEFAEVQIIPGDLAYFLCANKKGAISLKPEFIEKTLTSRGINTVYARDYYLTSKLSAERLEFLDYSLRSAESAQKNMDFYPISYFYDMVLWSAHFNFSLARFFMFFTKNIILLFSAGAFIILFAIFFFRRGNKNFEKEITLLSLCTTGLSEISFEILIVLAFQIIYGYLYYKIGIIVTSFMFGLGLGSIYATRRLSKILHPLKTYIKVQVSVFIYPILLLACIKIFSSLALDPAFKERSADLFAILPLIAGFVGGVQYPIANKICLARESLAGKTAGATYAFDLLGSFIGALFLSAFFVPILGIPVSCILLSILNAISLALLLIARQKTLTHLGSV